MEHDIKIYLPPYPPASKPVPSGSIPTATFPIRTGK